MTASMQFILLAAIMLAPHVTKDRALITVFFYMSLAVMFFLLEVLQ